MRDIKHKSNDTMNEYEQALEEMLEAKKELDLARQMFDFADQDYFEAANAALTAAEEKYKVSSKRLSAMVKDKSKEIDTFPKRESFKEKRLEVRD